MNKLSRVFVYNTKDISKRFLCPFLLFSYLKLKGKKKNIAHILKFKDIDRGTTTVYVNSKLNGKKTLECFFVHRPLSSWPLPMSNATGISVFIGSRPRFTSFLHRCGLCPSHPHGRICGKWGPACVHCKRLVPGAPSLLGRHHRREAAGCVWISNPRWQWPLLCGIHACGQKCLHTNCVLHCPQPCPHWREGVSHLHPRWALCVYDQNVQISRKGSRIAP